MKRASLSAVFALVVGVIGAPLVSAHAHDAGTPGAAPVAAGAASAATAANAASASASSKAPNARAPVRKKHRAASPSHARAATHVNAPFAFRGIPLGITLDDLRASDMVRATPHESALLCESDLGGSDLGMTVKSDASSTIACRWAHHDAQRWAASSAVVDGVPSSDHILRFARASVGEPLRLYEMSFVVDATTAFDLRDALAAHYGVPHLLGEPSLPLLVWENASSTITICVLPDTHRATITYLLKSADPHIKGSEKTLKVSQFDVG